MKSITNILNLIPNTDIIPRYILVDNNNNIVQSIIVYNGSNTYTVPSGLTLYPNTNNYNVGDTYKG